MTKRLIIFLLFCTLGCSTLHFREVSLLPGPHIEPIMSNRTKIEEMYGENQKNSEPVTFVNSEGVVEYFLPSTIDSLTGETLAVRELSEVLVTAQTNNIAERDGKIVLGFIITAPQSILKSTCQSEFTPVLSRGSEKILLPPIILSGHEFKRSQLRGYKKYEKFLSSIIPEDAPLIEHYVKKGDLQIFLERYLPHSKLFMGFSNSNIATAYGVSEEEILNHYLKKRALEKNREKINGKEEYFNRYVKTPYRSGARLDSIVDNRDGSFSYHYTQELFTNAQSNRLKLWVEGSLQEKSGLCFSIPTSDTITYNVSSVSGLTQKITRYLTKTIYRRKEMLFESAIVFNSSDWRVRESVGKNGDELFRVKEILEGFAEGDEYYIDTLIITSSSSPDGKYNHNKRLSNLRAESVRDLLLTIHGEEVQKVIEQSRIVTRSIPEDWHSLEKAIQKDSLLSQSEVVKSALCEPDPDRREALLAKERELYRYIKERYYPPLRKVTFLFKLLKRDMEQETTLTNQIDTLYNRGVALLQQREYKEALAILNNYTDINTAIAHLSLGHDATALSILQQLEECASQQYLIAIAYARRGEREKAVLSFLRSKELDIKMAYRGELDPEISSLIEQYNLNRDLFE